MTPNERMSTLTRVTVQYAMFNVFNGEKTDTAENCITFHMTTVQWKIIEPCVDCAFFPAKVFTNAANAVIGDITKMLEGLVRVQGYETLNDWTIEVCDEGVQG